MTPTTAAPTATSQEVDITERPEGEADDGTRHDLLERLDHWTDAMGMRIADLINVRLPELRSSGRELIGGIRIEEIRDEDGLTINAELPGIDPSSDLDITVEDGSLHIVAHRTRATKHTESIRYHSEFRYGEYRRTCELPDGAVPGSITARYDQGILMVWIPIPRDARTVAKVPVTVGADT